MVLCIVRTHRMPLQWHTVVTDSTWHPCEWVVDGGRKGWDTITRSCTSTIWLCLCSDRSTLSDRVYKFHCSSLNTRSICIILSAFERREHSQDNANFLNAKISFFGLGRTYNEYFRRWIWLNYRLHGFGKYGALWVLMHVNNVYKYNRSGS